MTREGDPPLPWSCRLRSAQAAEREPRWHKGGPRIEAQIQRVSVEPRRQKGRARGAAAAVVPKAAARTSHGEGRKPRGAQSCQGSGHPGVRRSQQLGCSHRKGASSIAPAVPHSVARPLGRLGLADGDDLVAGAIDAGRGNPVGELVSNRGEVCERGLELSLGLSPGLLGWGNVEDGRAGRRVRSGRRLRRRSGEPGKAERSRRGTEGDAVGVEGGCAS